MNDVKSFQGVIALLAWAGGVACAAQSYPSKPIRYIVPFPAAATPDIIARTLTERLSRQWGQQVVVDNRAGAGGTLGAGVAAKAPADGYTLFQCNIASSAIAEALYTKLPYNQQRDFAPITLIAKAPNVLIVYPPLPAQSLKEFIAYARANPGKLTYGSSGAGASPHLAMELFKLAAKIDVTHVAYKGSPPALADLIGGQISSSAQTVPAALPAIHSGRVRAMAVTSLKRIPQLPDTPSFHEAAIPGFEVNSWFGLCAPTGTPVAILDKVHADTTAVLRTPDVQKRFGGQMIDVAPSTRNEFAKFIAAETERWKRVVKEAGIPQQ